MGKTQCDFGDCTNMTIDVWHGRRIGWMLEFYHQTLCMGCSFACFCFSIPLSHSTATCRARKFCSITTGLASRISCGRMRSLICCSLSQLKVVPLVVWHWKRWKTYAPCELKSCWNLLDAEAFSVMSSWSNGGFSRHDMILFVGRTVMLTSMCSIFLLLVFRSHVCGHYVWNSSCLRFDGNQQVLFSLLRPRILEEEFQGLSCRTWPQKIDTMGLGIPQKITCIKSGTAH